MWLIHLAGLIRRTSPPIDDQVRFSWFTCSENFIGPRDRTRVSGYCVTGRRTNHYSGANAWGYLSRGWSAEYHICYYIPKYSSWSVDFKSSVYHLGKPCITLVFKMASKTAATYRNDPWNNNACLNRILCINFVFKHPYHCQKMNIVYL